MNECLFCQAVVEAKIGKLGDAMLVIFRYDCKKCGYVSINDEVADLLEQDFLKKYSHIVSGYLRELNYKNMKYKYLTYDAVKDIPNKAEIPKIVPDQVDKVIEFMGLKSKIFGHLLDLIPDDDYPISYSRNAEEFNEIIKYLIGGNLIEKVKVTEGSSIIAKFKLTYDGMNKFYSLRKTSANSKQCFVAMCFGDEYDLAYRKIEEALNDCGYKAYRVKEVQHNDVVTDLIITEIKRSRFVIADFSDERQSAYFEAGYAKGLAKEVIWMCKKGGRLHFDTQQYSHIIWEDEEDLKKKLILRVKATIE